MNFFGEEEFLEVSIITFKLTWYPIYDDALVQNIYMHDHLEGYW